MLGKPGRSGLFDNGCRLTIMSCVESVEIPTAFEIKIWNGFRFPVFSSITGSLSAKVK